MFRFTQQDSSVNALPLIVMLNLFQHLPQRKTNDCKTLWQMLIFISMTRLVL
ncbi:MAG: hypothetical protein ABI723_03350 [Bacteroidia bacterium]